jgi:hypothetical protein
VRKAVPAQQQVIQHSAAFKQLDVLKSAPDAAVHHLVPRQRRDVLAFE